MEKQIHYKQIYDILLKKIKEEDHYDINNSQFLKLLSKELGTDIKNFIEYIMKLAETKKIYFIRHAESKYNHWKKKSLFNMSFRYQKIEANIDPEITQKGKDQCKSLQQKMQSDLKDIKFDVVYVSPMTRTCETFGYTATQENQQLINNFSHSRVIGCHYVKERFGSAANIGRDLNYVRQNLFQNWHIDGELVQKDDWWSFKDYQKSGQTKFQIEDETIQQLERRLLIFFLFALLSEDENICIVSHSSVFKRITMRSKFYPGSGIKNAQIHQLTHQILKPFLSHSISQNMKTQ
ncbi:histidine phosphatase family (branch protein 1) (macronuclear) [Tetrahymena thermophila SB210]|uniref:Histidine phosphatase family (Branch protein 1) n=1 Tax=Tetrahymena thermophila (strain SB210) TaxID=312017 RepID=Q23AC2_TETTS|nr:histidine phosphatase family (branch protein 1) [Tetrahymena thermophila SB210]EAR93570.2 histidine phosphatase family (branch protein 1) [Tetrahymena thermophila SB210]|eukprot:XP_001013815.2 histidine phosphatase family (branch protein 1) [Tetrahymena thermophila SB210]